MTRQTQTNDVASDGVTLHAPGKASARGVPATTAAEPEPSPAPAPALTPSIAPVSTPSSTRAPSKLDVLVALLHRPAGASLAEMRAVTGWQPHSLRGALAGALRKRGHAILSETHDGGRRYRIVQGGAGA